MVGARVANRLEDQPEYGLRPVGFLDADPPDESEAIDRRQPVLGSPDELVDVVERTGAEHLILAFSRDPDRGLLPIIRRCDELGLEVSLVPRLYESINERVALEHVGGLPLLALKTVDPKGWQFTIKHGLDRVAAALGLIVLGPLLLAVALAVRLTSAGPDLLPPGARRPGRPGLRPAQVPVDAGRATTPASSSRRRAARRAASRGRTGARRSARGSGAGRSTSSRSSSTCCAAR